MRRLLLYPFAGAALGVLAAATVIPAIGGNAEGTFGVALVAGIFLAGSGAIAGAILGAAEMFRTRMDHQAKPAQDRNGVDTET